MNLEQYLLVCIMEEASEVAKAAAKMLRFGVNDKHESQQCSNFENFNAEYNDMLASVELATILCNLDVSYRPEAVARKKQRILYFMKDSVNRGTVTEEAFDTLKRHLCSR